MVHGSLREVAIEGMKLVPTTDIRPTVNGLIVPVQLEAIHLALGKSDQEFHIRIGDGLIDGVVGDVWEEVTIWPISAITQSPEYLKDTGLGAENRLAFAGNGQIFFVLNKSGSVSLAIVETGEMLLLTLTLDEFLGLCLDEETVDKLQEKEDVPWEDVPKVDDCPAEDYIFGDQTAEIKTPSPQRSPGTLGKRGVGDVAPIEKVEGGGEPTARRKETES